MKRFVLAFSLLGAFILLTSNVVLVYSLLLFLFVFVLVHVKSVAFVRKSIDFDCNHSTILLVIWLITSAYD